MTARPDLAALRRLLETVPQFPIEGDDLVAAAVNALPALIEWIETVEQRATKLADALSSSMHAQTASVKEAMADADKFEAGYRAGFEAGFAKALKS